MKKITINQPTKLRLQKIKVTVHQPTVIRSKKNG